MLQYRLYLKQKLNIWYPKKRFKPSNKLSNKRKKIYALRSKISENSQQNFVNVKCYDDINKFKAVMNPLIDDYDRLFKKNAIFSILSLLKSYILK